MITCECGHVHHPDLGEKSVSSIICPKCGRKMKQKETWIQPIGEMNMLEAKEFQGDEINYLNKRKIKNGY